MKAKRLIDVNAMTDAQIREFVLESLLATKRRGFMNTLGAESNAELRSYILEKTAFLDGDGMEYVNMQTRVFVFANGLTRIDQLPHCETCGKLIKKNVTTAKDGFKYRTCSPKCNAARPEWLAKHEATKLAAHGDKNWNNSAKREKTCMEKYGHKTNMATSEFRKMSKATRLERYGDENFVNPEKSLATKRERYGENGIGDAISAGKAAKAAADPEYYARQKARRRKTKKRLYGDPSWNNREKARATFAEHAAEPGFIASRRERTETTCERRYGKRSYSATPEYRKQVEETSMRRYGASNYSKTEQCKDRIRKTSLERYGVRSYLMTEESKKRTSERINTETYARMLAGRDVVPAFTYEYYVANKHSELPWKCKKCGNTFYAFVNKNYRDSAGSYARCVKCDPPTGGTSRKEREMQDFVLGFDKDAAMNDRRAIRPLELDAYSELFSAGFEFDGMFWHSSLMCDDGMRLARKTLACEQKGIRLIHVFEDEWNMKRHQVEKAIAKRFMPETSPCGRLSVRAISDELLDAFEKDNSPMLFIKRGKSCVGLFDGETLVAAMSYNVCGRDCRIVSFTENADVRMKGSFCKLLGYVEKRHHISSVAFKQDSRYPDPDQPVLAGMTLTRRTRPAMWLLSSRLERIGKIYSKKDVKRLTGVDVGKGETLIRALHENGYAVIYDCGCSVYEKTFR